MLRSLTKLSLVSLTALLVSVSVAQADPLNLGVVFNGTGGTNWDRTANSTYQFTLTATNGASPAITTLNGWLVGLQIFEHGATSGTTNPITVSNLGVPVSNSILTDPDLTGTPVTTASLPAVTATGLTSYTRLTYAENDPGLGNTINAGATKNLGLVTITSPNLAGINGKTFDVYAVANNSTVAPASSWQDTFGSDVAWGSPPISNTSGNSVLLGTFTVSTAVPEPGSLLLATISGLGMCGYRWRRGRTGQNVEDVQTDHSVAVVAPLESLA